MQQKFETKKPKINRPKFKIFDIPANVDQDQLVKAIYEQNFSRGTTYDDFKQGFIPLFKTGPRDEHLTQWIIEIGEDVRQLIPETDRVFFEWQACKVKPYTIITRCYKCHRYGHSAKSCAQEVPTCGHCSKEGHSLKDCLEKNWDYKCVNCIRERSRTFKHDVASNNCPQYTMELKRAQKQISYNL